MPSQLVKDSLRLSVEAASGGKVTVLYDDQDNPSYMRRFAPMTIKELYRQYFASDEAWNASAFKAVENEVHPAFLKNGTRIRELLVGKYHATALNGRACSLPGTNLWQWINHDNALAACKSKGAGWTMMTMYIWGFLQALCLRQKYQPRGNTQYGRSHEVTWETALREDGGIPGVTTGMPRTKPGTGPASWNHDGTETGISDLVGNVWDWGTLMKLVDGKIMMPEDNNIDLAEASWPDTGARYDSTVGTADGTEIDLSGGDLGDPVVSDVITKYTGLPGTDTYYKEANISSESGFRSMTKKSAYTPPLSLILAGLAPIIHYGGAYESGYALKGGIWTRNYGTRLPLLGGAWHYTTAAGLGALLLNVPRGFVGSDVGFRPAFLLV
jgi:hypothetical protein